MATKIAQKAIIVSFMIIGTILALYISITGAYDIFVVHTTWMHRDGLILKIIYMLLCADFPLLFLAGLTSIISFFRKGYVWRPVTKVIIINVILWLIYAGIMIGLLVWGFIYKIIGLLIIGSCIWLMLKIWKMIRI